MADRFPNTLSDRDWQTFIAQLGDDHDRLLAELDRLKSDQSYAAQEKRDRLLADLQDRRDQMLFALHQGDFNNDTLRNQLNQQLAESRDRMLAELSENSKQNDFARQRLHDTLMDEQDREHGREGQQYELERMRTGAQLSGDASREADERGMSDWREKYGTISTSLQSLLGGNDPSLDSGYELPGAAAARQAAFNRAKEQSGRTARASMDTLRSAMAERGVNVAGGQNPLLARSEADLLGREGNLLGEVSRDQAISDAQRAGQVADRNFSAQQQRRSQLASSLLSLMR